MTRPRTRSVARAEAEAEPEEARKRTKPEGEGDAADAGVQPGSNEPDVDAVAAQLAFVPYAEDIYQHLRSLEAEPSRRPRIDYDQDGIISFRMRGILLDWLVGVAYAFDLLDDTLHLAVSYIDRFISTSVISRDTLQLLGVTALFVACKYEEVKYRRAKRFSDITAKTYTVQQVVKMERDLLKGLNFDVGSPTVKTFLWRFLTSCRGGNQSKAKKLKLMCNYLAELSLLDHYCLRFLPSAIAAACLFVARFTINPRNRPWNLTLQRNTGYKVSDVKDCIFAMHDLQLGRKYPDLQAVRNKYKDSEFECVSTITPPQNIPVCFLKDLGT